jgi:hypothetical protein
MDLQSPSSFMTFGLLGVPSLHPGTDIGVKCPNPAHDTLLAVGISCKMSASHMLMASKQTKTLDI